MTDELISKFLGELKGAARFRWISLAVAWIICAIGWLVVLTIPDRFQANARILVDTRTALTPILQGLAIQQDVGAQLNYVAQSLLGKEQLEKIATQVGLTTVNAGAAEKSIVIKDLKAAVTLNGANSNGGGTVFYIRYEDSQRERALEVVKILLDDFVKNTLGGKQDDSATAQQFLVDQIKLKEDLLSEAEQRLANFKKRNFGVLPGQNGDYFSVLQKESEEFKSAEGRLAVAQKRRDELARQLRGEVPLVPTGPSGGEEAKISVVTDTSSLLKDAESRLNQLRLMYTDKHPDVVAMRENISQLKQRQAAELVAIKRGDAGAAAAAGATTNPIYQSIQLALNQTDVEIAALRAEYADRQRKITELRTLINTVPEVEAEYQRLNRDYDINRAQYSSLVERLERAKLGDQAEASGSIRFEVIDPPNASFEPVAPKRKMLLSVVLLAGLGAAAGVAYLLHLLKPVFLSARSVYEKTGLPVLGIVSVTGLDGRQRSLARSYVACGALVALLLVGFVGVVKYGQLGVGKLISMM